MKMAYDPFSSSDHNPLEGEEIRLLAKQRQPRHGAVEHVVDKSSGGDTSFARHEMDNTMTMSVGQ